MNNQCNLQYANSNLAMDRWDDVSITGKSHFDRVNETIKRNEYISHVFKCVLRGLYMWDDKLVDRQ